MLILTRRLGETLLIGDDITITVLGVKGNQVRIGTNAPEDVRVIRTELLSPSEREANDAIPEEGSHRRGDAVDRRQPGSRREFRG